jgi:hypothetical protein
VVVNLNVDGFRVESDHDTEVKLCDD